MSTQTTNLHLTKPDDSEYPDVSVINGNMDTIDAKIGAVGNTSLQDQIDGKWTLKSRNAVDNISFNYAEIDGSMWFTIHVGNTMVARIASGKIIS